MSTTNQITGVILRVLGGLLGAGLVAPLTLLLPESLQGGSVLVGVLIAGVAAALLWGGRRDST